MTGLGIQGATPDLPHSRYTPYHCAIGADLRGLAKWCVFVWNRMVVKAVKRMVVAVVVVVVAKVHDQRIV